MIINMEHSILMLIPGFSTANCPNRARPSGIRARGETKRDKKLKFMYAKYIIRTISIPLPNILAKRVINSFLVVSGFIFILTT